MLSVTWSRLLHHFVLPVERVIPGAVFSHVLSGPRVLLSSVAARPGHRVEIVYR